MTHTVALASRASSGTQNKGTLQESCRTSHPFPCCFTWGGHSCSKFTTGVSDLVYRGPLPKTCRCTAQHNLRKLQKMARAIFSQVTVLAAFSGGSVSRASNQQKSGFSKVWSATDYSLRPSSHFSPSLSSGNDSLLPLLDLWERRHLTRGALRSYTGDIELDQFFIFPAASAALAQGRSSLASRCTFSFWLCATSSSSSLPVVPFSPKSPRVARTLQAEETGWRTSQLDCPKVGRTRQAEETGSRCSHLHQVGEEFLNSEVASEVPAVLPAGRVGGTGGIRGRKQRTSSARLLRGRSLPPWTTETPLASVPRGDGNVGRGCVGAGFSDGVSDHRSGLKATLFPSLPCFPFRCPFKRVVRRLSTPRCVQERGGRVHPADRARERVRRTGTKVHAG